MPKTGHTVEFDETELRNMVADAADRELKKTSNGNVNAQGRHIEFQIVDGKLVGARVTAGQLAKVPA